MNSPHPQPNRHWPGWSAVVLLLFFCSGATGLVYEITWTRLLRHVLGNTTLAVTTVLCAFMSGLALGSYFGGRWADRRQDHVRLYGLLEGAIGLYCLTLPWLIGALEPVFAGLYQNQAATLSFPLLRFGLCLLVLLVPATLMGATLPLLSRFFVRQAAPFGWPIGRVYSINTFGAALGCFAAGFVLLPQFGLRTTIYLATGMNIALCLAALWLQQRIPPAEDKTPVAMAPPQPSTDAVAWAGRWLLVGYAVSGGAALVYEVAWVRALALVFGSSTYAFSLMLTAFILGLAGGSYCMARLVDRLQRPMLMLGAVEVLIGVTALAVVPFLGKLPLLISFVISHLSSSFWLLEAGKFGLALAVMLVPTMLMGAAYPLVNRLCVARATETGATVGRVYAWNTGGAILGTLTGGFVLVPTLGIQHTILAAVAANLALGGLFTGLSTAVGRAAKSALAAGLLGLGIASWLFLPAWDPSVMSAGAYLFPRKTGEEITHAIATLSHEVKERSQVLFHEDGPGATVTVKEFPDGRRALYTNGKADASTAGDLATQQLVAHLPLLFHPQPKRVLVIGLASGISAGSAGTHPTVQHIDCVELEPAMARACRFFDDYNHRILDDPRFELIIEDGRSHVTFTDRRYDVIISEPSNPWIAGIADLFTKEYFAHLRERLTPGGIAGVWVQGYNIDPATVRDIVYTFAAVFPHFTIWEPAASDYLLIGATQSVQLDFRALSERLPHLVQTDNLARIKLENPRQLLERFLMDETAGREFARGGRLHTDDHAFVEYAAPRHLYERFSGLLTMEALNRFRGRGLESVVTSPADAAAWEQTRTQVATTLETSRVRFSSEVIFARGMLAEPKSQAEAVAYYREALALNTNFPAALNNLAWISATSPDAELRQPALAVASAERAANLVGGQHPNILDTLAAAYASAGRFDEAIAMAEKAEHLARQQQNLQFVENIQRRLQLYRARHPYRDDS